MNPNPSPNGMFKKGDAGRNPLGSGAPGHRVRLIFKSELAAIAQTISNYTAYENMTRIQALAFKCWDMAMDGDLGALKEIVDRLDGKVPQQQIVTGEDGGPVQFAAVEWVVVRPSDAENSDSPGVRAVPTAGAV